ncbi:MAG: hypothetical protein LBC99_01840 [Spirochaetota bacterium]|jgi:hypothetical protein|nr:hypothetical protein [Spirochaetota bacterium]
MTKRFTLCIILLAALLPVLIAVLLISASPSPELTLKQFTTPAVYSAWRHDGALEHMEQLRRLDVRKEGENTRYRVEAVVDDVSGGETKKGKDYYKVELQYLLAKDSLIQSGQRAPLMDAEFQTIELLRLPLTRGARWTQAQKNALGKSVLIDCAITNLQVKNGRAVLDVTYASRDGEHYAWRRFTGGEGLTRYEKRQGEYMFGFNLFMPEK